MVITTLVNLGLGLYCAKTAVDIIKVERLAGVKKILPTAVAEVRNVISAAKAAEEERRESQKREVLGQLFQEAFDSASPERKQELLAILTSARTDRSNPPTVATEPAELT